jgi:ribosomal protein S27AE
LTDKKKCSRCGDGIIRTWDELTEDEQEVVKRLPGSYDYEAEERKTLHRWCTRCWYESIDREGDSV